MSRIARIICFICVLILGAAALVRTLSAGDEWQPISADDLALKDNSAQPGSDAMVLYRQVDVDAKESTVDNYIRVKLFTQAGVTAQSDVQLEYDKSADESISGIRGRTIHSDGSVTEFQGKPFDKEIVKASGIKVLAKTFTMPNVQPGSIIEYKYRQQYNRDSYYNFEWTVQTDLYTRLARFSIRPDDSPGSPLLRSRYYNISTKMADVKKTGGLFTLELHDLPGIDDEPLMPPTQALSSAVEFFYPGLGVPDNETPDDYWKRMGKAFNEYVDRFVDKKKELTAEVSEVVAANDSPEEKLQKLYARALKIRNLDFEDEKSQKEQKQEQIKDNNNVEDVLKHGYGHAAQINFLLLGLARAAGFEAADLRVAGTNGRYFYPIREAITDLNAELIWVRAGGKEYYLDPGSHFYPFEVLPWYESAANGIRLTKDGAQMIRTPVAVSGSATILRHADLTIDSSMETTGKLQVDFTGQEAAIRRYNNRNDDEAGRKKAMEDEIKGWLPVGSTFEVSKIENWEDVEKPIHVEGNMTVASSAKGSVSRMLLPLDFFQTGETGWFQSQKRTNEIDFTYPYEKTDELVIHSPLGFKVQALPDPQKITPGPVSYEISTTHDQDDFVVRRHLVISGIRYAKEAYPGLRAFFSAVRSDDNGQAMLQSALRN